MDQQGMSPGQREGMASQGGASELSSLERGLLALPLAAGAVFGVLSFLAPGFLGTLAGYPANDHFVYRLAGAATLGYPVALAFIIRQGSWVAARLVVVGVLVFNLASLFACAYEFAKGRTVGMVYLIMVASLLFVAITGWMLYTHQGAAKSEPNIARWVMWLLIIGTAAATIFALLPLLVPGQAAKFFGYRGTDVFVYRQAGAACLGYSLMGILGLMSRNWNEFRWASVAAVVFNGLSFLASAWSLFKGINSNANEPALLPILVGVASLGVTVATLIAIQRDGK